MAVRTIGQVFPTNPATLLRNTLRLDGVLCGLDGIILAGAASWLAPVLGLSTVLLVTEGLLLLAFAAIIFTVAAREPISRRAGLIIGVLNLVFAIGSVVALIEGVLPLTTTGVWVVALVAVVDAVLGEIQLFSVWRMR